MKYNLLIILSFLLFSCTDNNNNAVDRKAKYNCLLDKVTSTDTLFLIYKYKGCFDQDKKVVKVFNKADTLITTFSVRQLDSNYFFISHLTEASITAYKNLENYLTKNKISEGLCTTTATISIIINKDSLTFIDQSCRFDLYSEFLRKTFIIPRPK